MSVNEQRAFDAWLTEPAHRAAYQRHRAVWRRYQAFGARAPAPTTYKRRPDRRAIDRRRRFPARLGASAIAASLALVIIGKVEDWPTWPGVLADGPQNIMPFLYSLYYGAILGPLGHRTDPPGGVIDRAAACVVKFIQI